MGCGIVLKPTNESIKGISSNFENFNIELNPDGKVENFFNKNNEKEKLSSFLVNIESISYYNGQSINEILSEIIKCQKIKIFSDYEKCKDISNKNNESLFFIVSKAYMEKYYKDFEEIKDKYVEIKKKRNF